MHYRIVPANQLHDEWLVEAINREGEGEIYSTLFYGQRAHERAMEYANLKNDKVTS